MGTTAFIKFSPLSTSSSYTPGAVELEFWAETTDTMISTTCVSPYVEDTAGSATPLCKNWNNYSIEQVGASVPQLKPQTDKDQISSVNEVSAVIATAGWGHSMLGFRVQHYRVRVDYHGDCRSSVQGNNKQDVDDTHSEGQLLSRNCIIMKWTACNAEASPTCQVNKRCHVEDLPDENHQFFTTHSITQYASNCVACMKARCESQCAIT